MVSASVTSVTVPYRVCLSSNAGSAARGKTEREIKNAVSKNILFIQTMMA